MATDITNFVRDLGLYDIPAFTMVNIRQMRILDIDKPDNLVYIKFNFSDSNNAYFSSRSDETTSIQNVMEFARSFRSKHPETEAILIDRRNPEYLFYRLYHDDKGAPFYDVKDVEHLWLPFWKKASEIRRSTDPNIVLTGGRLHILTYGTKVLAPIWNEIGDKVTHRVPKTLNEIKMTKEVMAFFDGMFCGRTGGSVTPFSEWAYNNSLPYLGAIAPIYVPTNYDLRCDDLLELLQDEDEPDVVTAETKPVVPLLPSPKDNKISGIENCMKEFMGKEIVDILAKDIGILDLENDTLYQVSDPQALTGESAESLGIETCYIYNGEAYLGAPWFLEEIISDDGKVVATKQDQLDYIEEMMTLIYGLEVAEFMDVGG